MFKKYFCVSLFAAVICFGIVGFSQQQPGMKTLTVLDAWNEDKTSPVKIVSVEIDNQQIVSDEPFRASDEWIRDLKFSVQNVSKKPIKQIVLRMDIPVDGRKYAHSISVGKNYLDFATPLENNPEILLKPGQSMDIQINTANPTKFQRFIERFQRSNITLAQLNTAEVYLLGAVFEETTEAWMKGKFMRRISDDTWKVIGK